MHFQAALLPVFGLLMATSAVALPSQQRAVSEIKGPAVKKRADCNQNPGLDKSKWVDVPAECSSCIINCMSSSGSSWTQGSTITDISVWRSIGGCGTSCSLEMKCTTRQAGTFQAQQPNNMPLDSKRKRDDDDDDSDGECEVDSDSEDEDD